jgi:hypothetical protein
MSEDGQSLLYTRSVVNYFLYPNYIFRKGSTSRPSALLGSISRRHRSSHSCASSVRCPEPERSC